MSAFSALAITSRQKTVDGADVCLYRRLSQSAKVRLESLGTGLWHHGAKRSGQRKFVGESLKASALSSSGPRATEQANASVRYERTKPGAPAAGLDHRHLAGPVNRSATPMRLIEADEVGAAAEQHVLAVVDDFVDAGMQVRRGAATEIAATFDELHAEAGFGQRTSGAHAGDAAADDGDGAGGASPDCSVSGFKPVPLQNGATALP